MMQFEITNRFTGSVQFECELSAEFENESYRVQLGSAAKLAVKAGADLRGADLCDADLTPIRDDLWAVLSAAPFEIAGLRDALMQGRVDGSTYTGECACLVGTIAKVRGVSHRHLGALTPDSSRPIERLFMAIKKGDTPENNQAARIALDWIDEWLHRMRAAFGAKASA